MNRKRFQRMLPAAGWILAIGLIIHSGLPGAYSKPAKEPAGVPAFRSGAQRSEEVLREMLTVLKRIDSRMARLEDKANGKQGR